LRPAKFHLQTDSNPPETAGAAPDGNRRKWCRRLFWFLAFGGASLCALYVFRAPLLAGLANAWIVNEPLANADVIVVLGGGRETRPVEAAKLYHQGLAPRILIMNSMPPPKSVRSLIPSDAELTRQILGKLNVPASALVVLGDAVTSSYEESLALRNWAKTNAITSVIIPTDIFHTRRVRWLYRKELKNTGIQVRVEAVPVREYTARDWWRNEYGIVSFQNEVLKCAYYKIKY
jgi:uncharacterized SAM-binding protein YcdF (DUF218 family)